MGKIPSGNLGCFSKLNFLSLNFLASKKKVKFPWYLILELPRWSSGKEPTCQCRRNEKHGFDPWVGKILWKRAWQPTPVFLPGEFHGQRSLAGCSPWGCKESDVTEQLTYTHSCVVFHNKVTNLWWNYIFSLFSPQWNKSICFRYLKMK